MLQVIKKMKKLHFILFFIVCPLSVFAQVELRRDGSTRSTNQDQLKTKTVIDNREKPPIEDYKIISVKNDTTHVDTTLTIYKQYKFNYLRKDNFELLAFSNIGQTYNKLAYDFTENNLVPDIGARAKHYPYYEVDDIYYYHVPTPLSELYFKTTFEQGQNTDAFFTSNLSPRFNFSIAYRGLRSLGKYQHILASQGSFRFTASYRTKNNRYHLKTHFVSQDLNNQENGGLSALANSQYQSGNPEFEDRSLLEVNYENAENMLYTKRFFLQQHYKILKGNDSTQNNQLQIAHRFNFTDKEYRFSQSAPFAQYGTSYRSTGLRDETEYQKVSNSLKAQFKNNTLGHLAFKLKHINYNYGYRRKLYLNTASNTNNTYVIPNRLTGDILAVGGSYKNSIGGFALEGDAMLNIIGDYNGHYLNAKAGYTLDENNKADAQLQISSRAPNFNFELYQSDYVNYNWKNNFDNIQTQKLQFNLQSKKIAEFQADLTRLDNYTYFGLKENDLNTQAADSLVTPKQYADAVSYLKLKVKRKFSYWRFSLDNTLMYQNVFNGAQVLKVPDFVTRNSLYYEDYWFQKALYLQTGFIFKYFTDFESNAYDPVLGEFFVQNQTSLDGFYTLDLFFNAKIRQTRIFFKLENFPTIFAGNSNYAAPSQPYRDFAIRFGLVWNFFL